MNKCQDHPNMVFKGTLHNEGHSVTFNIFDDYVEITDTNGAMISVSKIEIDNAIKQQKDLLEWGYQWV
tara:strand:+ start:1059 stop:1262 length:204 start_codon:yes stop_codon:yes gene_type:complete